MKIGIVSDTHGNTDFLYKVFDQLVLYHKITDFYHLGDYYEDSLELDNPDINFLRVPGINHPKYWDNTLQHKISRTIKNIHIILVHSYENDITSKDKSKADIILHGHTHHHKLEITNNLLTMNPGHLKREFDRREYASFGLLEITDNNIIASIFDLSFNEIKKIKLLKDSSRLRKI